MTTALSGNPRQKAGERLRKCQTKLLVARGSLGVVMVVVTGDVTFPSHTSCRLCHAVGL